MKKAMAAIIIVAIIAPSVVLALTAEKVSLDGTVVSYLPGESITIENQDGTHTFSIAKDAKVIGEITKGVSVVVNAIGNSAVYVAVLGGED